MSKEEIEDILEELHLVRPEILAPKAKKLFEAIMSIADERDKFQQENQELKKQLEENQNPLKGIFAQVNDDTLLRDCGNMNAEINELKNQQKEFIEYLENEKERCLTFYSRTPCMYAYDVFKDVLSKYKEIIGDNK